VGSQELHVGEARLDGELAALAEHLGQRRGAPLGVHHQALGVGLIGGEHRHHVGAAIARDQHLVGADHAELDLARVDHLHDRRARPAGDLDRNAVTRERAAALRLEQPAELGLGLPVQRDPRRAARPVAPARGEREQGGDRERSRTPHHDSSARCCQRRSANRHATSTAANSARPSAEA
jgi:hypothetical protein